MHKPHPLSSLQDHPRRNFPRTTAAAKTDQFKPVLASAESIKNLKCPNFSTNFTHFCFEFLKDFYIFRISGCPGSFWYQWLQDSSSINEKNIAPRKWSYQFDFYCIVIYVIHRLIIFIKTIFL